MRKWAFALTVAFLAVVSIAAGAVALTDGGDGGPSDRIDRGADGRRGEADSDDDDGDGGGTAAICLEGAVDCDDTIDEPPANGDACIDIYPRPPECGDPEEPVSTAPPLLDDQPATGCASANSLQTCEEAAISLATDELARRLGNADGLTLVSIEFVEWPDSCLGIDTTDVACAEVITPGYRIFLEANGQKYEYHTDGGSTALLVE